jgi:hypothetical protein
MDIMNIKMDLMRMFEDKIDPIFYKQLIEEVENDTIDDNEFITNFFIYVFNFCGCGCLTLSADFIKEVLNCFEEEEDLSPHLNLDKLEEYTNNKGITDFILHFLDTYGITDHGSSVYGSWLTLEGQKLKEYLNEAFKEEEESE